MLATDTLLYNAKERVYYKEVYSEWTQPIFNANNFNDVSGNYVLTASHQANPAWYAFNASNTGNNCWWTNHGTPSETNFCWVCFYSTKKMKFNSIQIKNETESPVNFKTGVLQGSQDGQTWVDLCALTGQNTTALEMTFDFENDTGYYYYRCYFTEAFGAGVAIQWIKFYGTQHTNTVISTEDDSDYSVETVKLQSLPMNVERKYYKRLWRPWDYTPALTANDSDPNFIVSADTWYTFKGGGYYPWRSFAKSKDYVYPWISADRATGWYQIKTTAKIRIYHITHKNRQYDGNTGSAKNYDIYGSLDGINWEHIGNYNNDISGDGAWWTTEVKSTKAYYYHKFVINSHNQTTAWCSLGFPTIYAEEEYGIEGATAEDYDFYIDEPADFGAATYPELKYYKRGIEPNVVRSDTTGTAVIEDGVIKNINAASRIRLPKYPRNVSSYEIQLKFKIGAYNDGRLIGNYKTNIKSPQIEVPSSATQTGDNRLWFGHPGSSAWVGCFMPTPLDLNKDYWVKAIWNGSHTFFMLSEDGVNFQLEAYNTSAECAWTEEFQFGVDVDGYAVGAGTEIDLKESYIKINGEMWWHGTFPEECSEAEAEWSEWINTNKPIN